jgi:hypothetical protein
MERSGPLSGAAALRGDYAGAACDYVVAQDWEAYTPAMHGRWRRLHARPVKQAPMPRVEDSDAVQQARTRARQRLIGAVVLVGI